MATRTVRTSCKNTKVRTALGACAIERPTMKKGGSTKSVLKKAQIGGSTNRGDYDINTGMNPSSEPIMQSAKKGGTSPFGILSIIAGIDNNSGKTAADRIAGARMAKGGTVHPGFKSVQSKIAAKQGISKQAAGAILASSARKASAKAKAKNPRLKKVK